MSITAQDLQGMVSHWLGCPPNGYLGSGYGSGVEDLLHTPLRGEAADALIGKLRADIPVAQQLPAEAFQVFADELGPDRLRLYIAAAGRLIPLGDVPAAA